MDQEALFETAYEIATIVVTLSICDYVNKKIKLQKTSIYEGKIISDEAPCFEIATKEEKRRIIKLVELEHKDLVRSFMDVVRLNLDSKSLALLYHNLSSLKIKKQPVYLGMMLRLAASYNTKKNKVQIFDAKAFFHEMFHVSSSKYDDKTDTIYSGFAQQKNLASIGKAMSEGYTELLTKKYFQNKNKRGIISFADHYDIEVNLVKMIESLYDDPKELERYYFAADLPGLIKSLERFAPRETVIKMVKDIDYISDNCRSLVPVPKYKALKKYKEVKCLLDNWFKSKENDVNCTKGALLNGNKYIDLKQKVMVRNKNFSVGRVSNYS